MSGMHELGGSGSDMTAGRGASAGPAAFSIVYAAAGGHVMALDMDSGVELWRTKLPTGAFDMGTDTIAVMLARADALIVSYCGRVYRLDPLSGEIIWTTELAKIPTHKQITVALLDASALSSLVGAMAVAQAEKKSSSG